MKTGPSRKPRTWSSEASSSRGMCYVPTYVSLGNHQGPSVSRALEPQRTNCKISAPAKKIGDAGVSLPGDTGCPPPLSTLPKRRGGRGSPCGGFGGVPQYSPYFSSMGVCPAHRYSAIEGPPVLCLCCFTLRSAEWVLVESAQG